MRGRSDMRPMAALLLLACTLDVQAGQTCDEKPLSPGEVIRSMDLAQRAGQDLSRYGVRYSHMGVAVRDHPRGRWTVVHQLNDCGTSASGLYYEGMGNFFLTDQYRFEAQLIVPGNALQDRLAALFATRTPLRMHEARYNMVAYVYSTQYQNSNQWVLENLAAASAPPGEVATREEAQGWLKEQGYQPPTLAIPASVRLGAPMFRANVAFDDHPFDRRMAGQTDTVTTQAVRRLVRAVDPQAKTMVIE